MPAPRVVMLLENNPYELDVRVRGEARSLAAAGYDVTVLAPRAPGTPARAVLDGVRVERFRLPEARGGALSFAAEYLVAAGQLHARGLAHLVRGADVLHLHNPPDLFFGLGALARLLGRAVVFDHHDLAPEMTEAKFGSPRLRRAMLVLERATFRVSSAVLAANASHREVAVGRGGVDPARVTIVRNGPPRTVLDRRSPGRDGALADPVVVFVGEMAAQDGVAELPDMLAALTTAHGLPGARLVLVGRGPMRAELEAAFAARGLTEQVTFTGQVSHDEVFGLVAAADVCVDPSPPTPYNERSTMIKIAEYLAVGRPVVAHALRETRRTAGDAARYVSEPGGAALAAAVAELAADPLQRTTMVARGRARARELTWDVSERALLAAYATLLGRPASVVEPVDGGLPRLPAAHGTR